jgi:hypothetical protein
MMQRTSLLSLCGIIALALTWPLAGRMGTRVESTGYAPRAWR